MRLKTYVALLLFISLAGISRAQVNGSVKGQLTDTAEHKDLTNALVAVLSPKDSTLISFTRTGKDGTFTIPDLDTGSYLVMISHPYFADIFETATVSGSQPSDIGTLNLFSKIQMMKEVIVKTDAAIRVKGDTTIFAADSFKVKEGANVEELLRKLPGITVDRNGKITAMGETVKNVLVDGEEFFGSDPGIATKNLRADIVKNVEVYDKKSDQATFTGIDDGVRDKTINLKLKEDKKKGYFGKIEAGGGLKGNAEGDQDKFNNAIMLNAFKGKRKLAAYGIMSNTGTLNLNWDDAQKYGGANIQASDNGDYFYSTNMDWNSATGIPTNWNAGLHYSNKFNKDMHSVNGGYKITKINAPAFQRQNSRYFYPDTSYNTNSTTTSYNTNIKQSLNATYEVKLDSMNTLKLTATGNRNETNSSFVNDYETLTTNNDTTLNKQNRHGSSNIVSNSVNSNLLWMHKFKKQYRTLSVNAGFNYFGTDNNSINFSSVDYYRNNEAASNKTIDQNTLSDNQTTNFSAKISYTEPLAKDFYMELNYAFGINRNRNNRTVYGKGVTGAYNSIIDSLSNDYQFNNISNTPGINFRRNSKKYDFSFGTRVGFTNYEQINETMSTAVRYNFTNYFPQANFRYKFKPSESINFYYYGSTSAPSLSQLQPILDYSDPLNLYIGNPDLKPSFNNRFQLFYNSFQMLKQRNIYANILFNTTSNAFVQRSWLQDSIRYYQTVNTNGNATFNAYMGYGFKIKKPDIRLDFSPQYGWSRNVDFAGVSFSDVAKNITTTSRYGLGLGFNKSKPDKFDIYVRPSVFYNKADATINSSANFKYWSATLYASANLQLPKNFELSTDAFGNYQQKYQQFAGNASYTKWNAYLSKKFNKNKYEAKFSVYDILDQNKGYSFTSNSFVFSETYRTTLRRFWMLSFIWNINKTGGGPAATK
ncbi:hypothetical protein A8C56_04610 [Niabella ginsenosidivorans]|uniref:Outer membrane protein beta-barrel domain-containing protein n=1 Tax=Niabella ginsenosidivorans TaxID=1176587 RepID=A0A1A9HYA7_9BACT|nr:outer membrane beta-barrel family protein [Niabella ginsenosidivorans]ANH80356.1 hypothetical protein A8C56_04610 [Niabella ginsenosidivorans]